MKKYDYSFLKGPSANDILRLFQIIAELNVKSQFRKQQYSKSFEALYKKAIVDSVRSSSAIEGIVASDKRIKEIVDGADPETHNEFEISGYKDALEMIFSNYDHLEITEQLIRELHGKLYSISDPKQAGKYKSSNNYIIEDHDDGTRRIRFTSVSSEDVPSNMEQLILAFYDAYQDAEISKLLLIPCFIVDFLSIHPFEDGNGRVSRLLNVLLLLKSGHDISRYISLERQINDYKQNYYDALELSSSGWHDNENDYTPFIIFSLQILYRSYKELDESFMELSLRKNSKAERVTSILMNSIVPISKQELHEKFPDISIKTIENVLSTLLNEGKIIKIGSYKDARYKAK